MKTLTYFTVALLLSSSVFAGGTIFGHHKTRSSNPDGVHSIGVYICGSLNCPDVILKRGDCGTVEHASVKYGVCVCDDGYKVQGKSCVLSEDKCSEVPLNECQQCDPATGEITNKPNNTPCTTADEKAGLCQSGTCVKDPSKCDVSEKVEKVYYQGACCTSPVYGLFCPDEAVPACEKMDETACAATTESACLAANGTWRYADEYKTGSICAPAGSKIGSNQGTVIACKPNEQPYCTNNVGDCVCKVESDSAICTVSACRACFAGEPHCGPYGGCICDYSEEEKEWGCTDANGCEKCEAGQKVVLSTDQQHFRCIGSDENAVWDQTEYEWCVCKDTDGSAWFDGSDWFNKQCVCGNSDTCYTDEHCGEGRYCHSDHTCYSTMVGDDCSIPLETLTSNCHGDAPYCDITTFQCTSEPKQYCIIASGVGGCSGSTPWCHYYDGLWGICTNEPLGAQCRVDEGLTCPDGYYCTYGTNGKACQSCPDSNALTCSDETGASTSCIDGYVLDDGFCYQSCSTMYSGTGLEADGFAGGVAGTWYDDVRKCRCPTGQVWNVESSSCISETCNSKYTGTTTDNANLDGFVGTLSNGTKCYCPVGGYWWDNHCQFEACEQVYAGSSENYTGVLAGTVHGLSCRCQPGYVWDSTANEGHGQCVVSCELSYPGTSTTNTGGLAVHLPENTDCYCPAGQVWYENECRTRSSLLDEGLSCPAGYLLVTGGASFSCAESLQAAIQECGHNPICKTTSATENGQSYGCICVDPMTCDDYPGSSLTGTGGEAGVSAEGMCYCPAGQNWDTTQSKCVS